MTHTPAEILRQILLSDSAQPFTDPDSSVDAAWALYVSVFPDHEGVPNQIASLIDTEGVVKHRILRTGHTITQAGVQLRLRSNDYQEAYRVAHSARALLEQVVRQNVVVSLHSFLVHAIMPSSSVLSMGQDERRRAQFSVNFLADIEAL